MAGPSGLDTDISGFSQEFSVSVLVLVLALVQALVGLCSGSGSGSGSGSALVQALVQAQARFRLWFRLVQAQYLALARSGSGSALLSSGRLCTTAAQQQYHWLVRNTAPP